MIFHKVREIILNIIELEEDAICLESHLYDDLDADSLDMAQIFLALETYYDISFLDDDLSSIKTVDDIINYIETELHKNNKRNDADKEIPYEK